MVCLEAPHTCGNCASGSECSIVIIGQTLSKSVCRNSFFGTFWTAKNPAEIGSAEARGRRRKEKLRELNADFGVNWHFLATIPREKCGKPCEDLR